MRSARFIFLVSGLWKNKETWIRNLCTELCLEAFKSIKINVHGPLYCGILWHRRNETDPFISEILKYISCIQFFLCLPIETASADSVL